MKVLRYILLLLTVMGWTYAAGAAEPTCAPSKANAKVGYVPFSVESSYYGWIGWKCDEGVWFTMFTVGEAAQWAAEMAAETVGLDKLLQAWRSGTADGAPLNPSELSFKGRVLVDHFDFPAKVIDGIAYKRRTKKNGHDWIRIGRIPVGTPCVKDAPAGQYMTVDVDLVVMDSKIASRSTEAFSPCSYLK